MQESRGQVRGLSSPHPTSPRLYRRVENPDLTENDGLKLKDLLLRPALCQVHGHFHDLSRASGPK